MVLWLSRLRVLAVLGVVSGLVLSTTPSFAAASATPITTWGTNGRVEAMISVGGNNVLGGDFTSVVDTTGHAYPASRLAVINASTGVVNRAWLGSADGTVSTFAVSGNTLFVGGAFSKVNNVAHRSIAALNLATGALVSTFTATANKPVEALAVSGSSLMMGGTFTSVTDATRTTARTYLAKAAVTTGAVDQTWAPKPDARVRALRASGTTLVYAGGDFQTVNGSSQKSTALLPIAGTGSPVTTYHGGATNNGSFAPVLDMVLVGSTLYLGAGGGGGGCTALNASSGARIWGKHTNGNVQAVTYNHGIVYCAGHFGGSGAFDGQTRYKIAAVSATAPYGVTGFAPRFNSVLGIWVLSADSGHLFTGGDFTKVNQAAHPHYAAFLDTP